MERTHRKMIVDVIEKISAVNVSDKLPTWIQCSPYPPSEVFLTSPEPEDISFLAILRCTWARSLDHIFVDIDGYQSGICSECDWRAHLVFRAGTLQGNQDIGMNLLADELTSRQLPCFDRSLHSPPQGMSEV